VYDAVVFDNDGVLTERTDRAVLRDAVADAFAAFDVTPPTDTLDALVAGVRPDELRDICRELELDPDAFWRERDRQATRHQRREIDAGRKPTYPDVEVLDALDAPLGVVSNNQHATIEYLFDVHDLHRHFETWYGREPTLESVDRKKPEPHYVERALEDLGTTNALYVGDKATDVQAAHAAGIDAAVVRRDHNRHVDLPTTPAYEVETLTALRDALEY
jgi:phosphoglycolate phosphatase